MAAYTIIMSFRDGHRFFKRLADEVDERLWVADQSGADPDETDDGPLYVDTGRPICVWSGADGSDKYRIPLKNIGGAKSETPCDEDEARWVASHLKMNILDIDKEGLAVRFPNEEVPGPEGLPKNAPPLTVDDLRPCWPVPSLFKTTTAFAWAAVDPETHWHSTDIPPMDSYQGQPATEDDVLEAARWYKQFNEELAGKFAQLSGYLAEPFMIDQESPESYRVYRQLLGDVLQELHDAMRSPMYRTKLAGTYERDR